MSPKRTRQMRQTTSIMGDDPNDPVLRAGRVSVLSGSRQDCGDVLSQEPKSVYESHSVVLSSVGVTPRRASITTRFVEACLRIRSRTLLSLNNRLPWSCVVWELDDACSGGRCGR